MIIKICGMRDAANIKALDRENIADWMGFIFYPKSARFVGKPPEYLPYSSKRVGVFVNANTNEIMQKVEEFGLHYVQLHGNETPEQCRSLRRHIGVIKTIPIASAADFKKTLPYEVAEHDSNMPNANIDYFLFETKCTEFGGSGQQFDWSLLQHYHGKTPFLLTGGIGPEDVEKLRAVNHPLFRGIDLNSRFETAPAVKDTESLRNFINKLTQ